jgi:molecular chaperone GrpE (heat shock protein)
MIPGTCRCNARLKSSWKMPSDKQQLKQKLIRFQQQISELKQALARKETQFQEREKDLFSDLFDIVDALKNIDTLVESKQDQLDKTGKKLGKNIGAVHRKLLRQLRSRGIVPIRFPDNKAAMETCKVIETREQPDLNNETILEVVKPGYLREQDGTVIRKAEVITVLNAETDGVSSLRPGLPGQVRERPGPGA